MQAVREKYAYDASTEELGLRPVSYEDNKDTYISGKLAEEVGFDKIRQQQANLKALRIVLVDALCIARPTARQSSTGDLSSDVEETCSRITDLNASRNLFEEWNEVLDIIRQLHSLQSLRADGLRLHSTTTHLPEQVMHAAPFTRLASLTLDDTLLPWADIVNITSHFPSLLSLSASGNGYKALPKTETQLPSTLTTITLERNEFKALSDLTSTLTLLPALKSLILKSNAISCVSLDTQTSILRLSSSITNLDLAYNDIRTLAFVDTLTGVFPSLTSLRTAHNPVYSSLISTTDKKPLTADDGYMLTLARLGKLQTLNYSVITDKERLNAEAYYLSQIAAELLSAGPENKAKILESHSRYDELSEIYGDPMVDRPKTSSSDVDEKSLAAGLCNFTFTAHEAVAEKASVSSFQLELPKSLTVYATLGIVGRKLGLEPMLLKLVWKTDELDVVRLDEEDDDDFEGTLPESDPSLSAHENGTNTKYRQEVLLPRIRQLDSWLDGRTANIQIKWSEEDVRRREARKARPV